MNMTVGDSLDYLEPCKAVKHQSWSILQKLLKTFSHQLFAQNAPSLMFDRFLN